MQFERKPRILNPFSPHRGVNCSTSPTKFVAIWALVSLLAGALASCTSTEPNADRDVAGASSSLPTTAAETESLEKQVLRAQADVFDRIVRKKARTEERSRAEEACKNGEKNPFCSTIAQIDHYHHLPKSLGLGNTTTRRRRGRWARPRFGAGNKLLNWADLQKAPASVLVETFGSLRLDRLKEIRRAALRETECPNNPAIAVAANLESFLPEDTSLEDLAYLFEKGAMCLQDQPADKENILTRAGLLYFAAKRYDEAANAFSKSIESDQFVARPLYWLYRTQMERGAKDKATATLETLIQRYPFSFHTLVATTASNRDPGEILLRTSTGRQKRSSAQTAINALIEQVEILQQLDYPQSASRVLDWAIQESKGTEPEVLLYLAELKNESGDHRSKIAVLSDVLYKYPNLISKETMELYFPKVYFPIFEKQSAQIDPYFLLAVARRESAFDVRAMSPAKAKGLMQVLPATARLIRRRSDLFDPNQNVEVGARYLTDLLKKMDGEVHLALAAYNAGPQRLVKWTSRYPLAEPILFIDLMPYRETREYVASILRNYYWYRRIHQTGEKLSYRQLLELAIAKGG